MYLFSCYGYNIRKKEDIPIVVRYSLSLYFLGLSLRNTSKELVIFRDENNGSHVSVWTGFKGSRISEYTRKRVSAFIIDETVNQIGNQHFWLWICIELIPSSVLGIYISEDRNILVAEKFFRPLVSNCGKHIVFTDGGV
jgi:putative transposase